MENKKIIVSFILFVACILTSMAQNNHDVYSKYIDSLKVLQAKQDKELTKSSKNIIKPASYKLIGPATYYNEATHSILRFDDDGKESYEDSLVYSRLIELYTKNPSAVHFYKEQYTDEKLLMLCTPYLTCFAAPRKCALLPMDFITTQTTHKVLPPRQAAKD